MIILSYHNMIGHIINNITNHSITQGNIDGHK